jgi:hypothetical protein
VKSWGELIRDCDGRLDFVQEKLRIEVSTEEIAERIAQLKSSILKVETEKRPQPYHRSGESRAMTNSPAA